MCSQVARTGWHFRVQTFQWSLLETRSEISWESQILQVKSKREPISCHPIENRQKMKARNERCTGRNFVFHFCSGSRSNLFNLFNRDKWLLMVVFQTLFDEIDFVEKISQLQSCKSASSTGKWSEMPLGIGAKFGDNLALRTTEDIETWNIYSPIYEI